MLTNLFIDWQLRRWLAGSCHKPSATGMIVIKDALQISDIDCHKDCWLKFCLLNKVKFKDQLEILQSVSVAVNEI